jgi:hypothetical protein
MMIVTADPKATHESNPLHSTLMAALLTFTNPGNNRTKSKIRTINQRLYHGCATHP